MIYSTVSVHSPESYWSHRRFAVQFQVNLRQFNGRFIMNPQRLQCDYCGDCDAYCKNFEQIEQFLLVGNSTANALKLRGDSEKLKNAQFAVEPQSTVKFADV